MTKFALGHFESQYHSWENYEVLKDTHNTWLVWCEERAALSRGTIGDQYSRVRYTRFILESVLISSCISDAYG